VIIKKKKFSSIFILLLLTLFIAFSFLVKNTPGLKGDIEQELRIFLKEPVLLKSKQINSNKFLDYLSKLYNGLNNKIHNKTNFKNIKIDVKFKELELLKNDRKKALKNKKLINPKKINIRITFEGNIYEAKARLKGDLSEHWGNNKQWSLRVKLKKNKTIMSMNEFSLTIHAERDYPYNFLAYEMTQRYKLLSPRYETVTVNFNGSNWGLMLMEEQFSESFYAKNRIKEGPIFKMTNEQDFKLRTLLEGKIDNLNDVVKWQGKFETSIFNEKKIRKKSNFTNIKSNNTLISIFKNIQEVSILNESNYVSKIIKFQNVEEFAKNLAIVFFLGDAHSYQSNNARYYLDPYNLKIRPILTDYIHAKLEISNINNMPLFYKTIFRDAHFQKVFFETVHDLKNNFDLVQKDILKICESYGTNCVNMFDLNLLKENIEILSKERNFFENIDLFQNKNSAKKFNSIYHDELNDIKLYIRAFNDGEIYLYNLTSELLKVNKIIFDNFENSDEQIKGKNILNKIIQPSSNNKVSFKEIGFVNNNYKSLKIYYSDSENTEYEIGTLIEDQKHKKNMLFDKKFFKHDFITMIDNNYIINEGTYIIENPIIVPEGNNLIINAGVTLKMKEDTYIEIQNGYFEMNGKKEMPISILSLNKDKKWSGIYNYSDDVNSKSKIKFATIKDSSQFNNHYIQLTGAINFINTNIIISDVNIKNTVAEDAINLVNSKMIIKDSYFENHKSDAIDIDFSSGKLKNNIFKKIGGDAIDLSGSNVEITDVYAEYIFDKVISSGEESFVKIENLKANNSGIVIASKDSSKVFGNKIFAEKCNKFDFITFQKKSYFKGGNMKLTNVVGCNKSLSQIDSILSINRKLIKEQKYDSKKLYE
jgi:hypothetical protein